MNPRVPNYDKEAREAVEYEGLPPLQPEEDVHGAVVFTNVRSVFGIGENAQTGNVVEVFTAQEEEHFGVVVVESGTIRCTGPEAVCLVASIVSEGARRIDTHGGSISPGLVTFGAPIGLQEIQQETSTNDGMSLDPLMGEVPDILGASDDNIGVGTLIRAVDGLSFGTRNALCASVPFQFDRFLLKHLLSLKAGIPCRSYDSDYCT